MNFRHLPHCWPPTREQAPRALQPPASLPASASGRMIDFAGRTAPRVGVGSRGARGSSLHLLVAVNQSHVPLGRCSPAARPGGWGTGRAQGLESCSSEGALIPQAPGSPWRGRCGLGSRHAAGILGSHCAWASGTSSGAAGRCTTQQRSPAGRRQGTRATREPHLDTQTHRDTTGDSSQVPGSFPQDHTARQVGSQKHTEAMGLSPCPPRLWAHDEGSSNHSPWHFLFPTPIGQMGKPKARKRK